MTPPICDARGEDAGQGGEAGESNSSEAGAGGTTAQSAGAGQGGGATAGSGGAASTSPHPVQLAIGTLRICALISDGRVYCWGQGLLGNGIGASEGSATPVEVPGITNAIKLTAAGGTTCALLADHTIKCWGSDTQAQISADGFPSNDYLTPQSVGGINSVNDVLTTGWSTCALLSNGTVRCWGSSDGGGGGTASAIKTMSSLSGATRLGGNVCAVLSDKTVKCWNGVGGTPTARAGLPANITQIAGNCALSSDGSVRCWGPGGQGQIGNGLTDDQTIPQQVQMLGAATWIGSGNVHVCAIISDQSFSCWGKDGFFSPIDYGPYPLPISGLGKVIAAAAGGDNTCVIESNSTVKCWGSNLSGYLLGPNGPSGNALTPVRIAGLPGGG
ncbi:MAG TPA: hypothetical protein VJV79_15500 [Polyangiaceae bacterium]|nr:hypothetical protein [Polyangiaceae bacterium]